MVRETHRDETPVIGTRPRVFWTPNRKQETHIRIFLSGIEFPSCLGGWHQPATNTGQVVPSSLVRCTSTCLGQLFENIAPIKATREARKCSCATGGLSGDAVLGTGAMR